MAKVTGRGKEITVACCVPKQLTDLKDKQKWAEYAVDRAKADLFLFPQEYLAGHHVQNIAKKRGEKVPPLHVDRNYVVEKFGKLAKSTKTAIGVGACVRDETYSQVGTEDYLYFDKDGSLRGWHRKFALPRYDDVRSDGAGRLAPEDVWVRRVAPVELLGGRLRVGTIFCWEVFATMLAPAYALAKTNLIAHPVKFAPRGWLKTDWIEDEQHIVGFGHAPKSQEWIDRLKLISRHETMCPIAISANAWDLGEKFKALTGHVDEILGKTNIVELGSGPPITLNGKEYKDGFIHTFDMNPDYYLYGPDNLFSPGAFKEATGSIDGIEQLRPMTMHAKMRKLESYLIGDITRLDMMLKRLPLRTKPSTIKRAEAHGLTIKDIEKQGFGLKAK